jgi:hypothetical protein
MESAVRREELARQHAYETKAQIDVVMQEETTNDQPSPIHQQRINNEPSSSLQSQEQQEEEDENAMEVDEQPLPTAVSPSSKQTVELLTTPKRQTVSDQSAEKDYRPSVRMIGGVAASTESPTASNLDDRRTLIKISETQHHSTETSSEQMDADKAKRLDVFKARNVHGHSADSNIQNLIYYNHETTEHQPVKKPPTQQQPQQQPENRVVAKLKTTSSTSSSSSSTYTITPPASLTTSSSSTSQSNEPLQPLPLTELELQERVIAERFAHFSERDTRVESINFDEIVRPYDKNVTALFHTDMVARVYDTFVYLPPSSHSSARSSIHQGPVVDRQEDFQFLIENENHTG